MEFYESEETNLLRRIVSWVTDVIVVIAIACFTVYAFGTQIPISGSSMQPALETEDVVLVNRLVYDFQSPDRFDVVVFRREDGKWNVKRVIGLPGETVQIKDGAIYIDSKEHVEDIYTFEIETPGIAEDAVKLGEGEYFVMGDNHTSSDDSRMADVGNVKREDIYGKVWFVASFGKNFGWIKD